MSQMSLVGKLRQERWNRSDAAKHPVTVICSVLCSTWSVSYPATTAEPEALRFGQKWDIPPKKGKASRSLLPQGFTCYTIAFSIQCCYFLLSWAGTAFWGTTYGRARPSKYALVWQTDQPRWERVCVLVSMHLFDGEIIFSKPSEIWLNDHLINREPDELTHVQHTLWRKFPNLLSIWSLFFSPTLPENCN